MRILISATFFFFIGLSTLSQASESLLWLETQDRVEKLGVEKIWFTNDLNQAVFLRSQRKEKFDQLDTFLNQSPKKIDSEMSHLNDTLYFYNMNNDEIKRWLRLNMSVKTSSIWFSIFIPKVYADSPECAVSTSSTNIETKEGQGFFRKITSFVNGDFIKKVIGCSTQDPSIDEKKNQSLSIENFSSTIKNHWVQLKEIITQLPHMPLPEDVKHELICDGLSVGIFVAQGAALSLTGAGAVVAIPRLYLALKRLMGAAKFLNKAVKSPTKLPVSAKNTVAATKTVAQKLENVYGTQKKFIENMQAAQKQILDKGGRLTESGKANSKYTELHDWAKAEVDIQKDFIKTLDNLEKLKGQSQLSQRISIQTERAIAEKRIKDLTHAFKF